MWQLKIYTFIMRCLILLFVAFNSFSMFTIFLNANLCMILFYLRQLLSMTQYILNYSHFLFLHKFNLRWLRNSFLWHAVADICCLRQQNVIFHYFHNLPLSQKLDPRLGVIANSAIHSGTSTIFKYHIRFSIRENACENPTSGACAILKNLRLCSSCAGCRTTISSVIEVNILLMLVHFW